jgi:hypothetical protein
MATGKWFIPSIAAVSNNCIASRSALISSLPWCTNLKHVSAASQTAKCLRCSATTNHHRRQAQDPSNSKLSISTPTLQCRELLLILTVQSRSFRRQPPKSLKFQDLDCGGPTYSSYQRQCVIETTASERQAPKTSTLFKVLASPSFRCFPFYLLSW